MIFILSHVSSRWCFIGADLLGSERGAHFAEGLKEVCVFDAGSLHVLDLKSQQSSLENKTHFQGFQQDCFTYFIAICKKRLASHTSLQRFSRSAPE